MQYQKGAEANDALEKQAPSDPKHLVTKETNTCQAPVTNRYSIRMQATSLQLERAQPRTKAKDV
jgi:hypothetical protein